MDPELGTVQPVGSSTGIDHDRHVCLRNDHRSPSNGGSSDADTMDERCGHSMDPGSSVLDPGGALGSGMFVLLCPGSLEFSWDRGFDPGVLQLETGLLSGNCKVRRNGNL